MGPNGDLSYEDFKAQYPGAIVNLMLCEGILRYVTDITKLNLDLNLKNFKKTNINEVCVWQCMSGGGAKHIYMHFVKKDDVPLKCIKKWSHKLNIHIGTGTVFRHIIKTTQDTHLRQFQYRQIYRILPSQRLFDFF